MKRLWNKNLRTLVLLLGCWLLFDVASHLTGEIFWFTEVAYLGEFLWRSFTQLGLWAIAFLTSVGFLFGNIAIANRFQYPQQLKVRGKEQQKRRIPHDFREFIHSTTHPHPPSTHTDVKLPLLLPTIAIAIQVRT